MRLTSGYIHLRQVRFYAFHGVMPQESRVGAPYIVDLRVGYPMEQAMQSDDVADALDYATLYKVVSREMDIPSELLEHVAGRIAEAIVQAFPQVTSIDLELTKQNPPMGADCEGASIEVHYKND